MKKALRLTRSEVYAIFKLCYMLIFVVELYILKVHIHPEGVHEAMLARFATGLMLEHVFYAFIILICGAALFERVF